MIILNKTVREAAYGGVMTDSSARGTILRDNKDKYRWICEVPMLKSFFLLAEIGKVLAIGAFAVLLLVMIIDLIAGRGWSAVQGAVTAGAVTFGILLILSIPAYLIVTWANNGKYTVLFEMDDSGIDHIQIKTEKASALEMLTMFVGASSGSTSTTAAGMLSASGGSLYSRFSDVGKIRAYPAKNVITLNGRLFRNQIYTEPGDFDFVYDYIVHHCPQADVREY